MWASERRAKDERAKTATEMKDFIVVVLRRIRYEGIGFVVSVLIHVEEREGSLSLYAFCWRCFWDKKWLSQPCSLD